MRVVLFFKINDNKKTFIKEINSYQVLLVLLEKHSGQSIDVTD